jgi:hypothetical protein
MKKIFSILTVIAMLLTFSSCSRSQPPELESVKPRIIELIEASYEINEIIFGNGLPVYKRGSEIAEEKHMYDNDDEFEKYDFVSEKSPYLSILQIKSAAEAVYSEAYITPLYDVLFVGVSTGNIENMLYARFLETDTWFFQYTDIESVLPGKRIYDYSTMKLVKPSNASYINVEMTSWLEGEEDEKIKVRISLILQDDGKWYLDSPTY